MINLDVIKMDVKGQVSVEYLLVILVVLLVFGMMLTKVVGPSIEASSDISKTSDAKTAIDTIANAVGIVYANGPGAKRTVSVYIPVTSSVTYNNNALLMAVTGVNTTSNGNIPKTASASVPYQVQVVNGNVNKQWYNNVSVQWFNYNAPITVTFA